MRMGRRWALNLLIGLGVPLVLVGGCVALLGKFLDTAFDLCGEETLYQILSPDREYVAAVFRRDCGATTSGQTRHVNLRRGSDRFPSSINGALDDGLVYITGRESWGRHIELHWKDAKHLVIRAPLDDPAARKTHWRDVSIRYEAVPLRIVQRRTGSVLLTVPTLWRANLRGARLMRADLRVQRLSGANLQGADLRYATFDRAVLDGADLRGANLEGADLHEADLEGADLRGANLHGANLTIAIYTPQTRWPDGFDPIKHDASLAE